MYDEAPASECDPGTNADIDSERAIEQLKSEHLDNVRRIEAAEAEIDAATAELLEAGFTAEEIDEMVGPDDGPDNGPGPAGGSEGKGPRNDADSVGPKDDPAGSQPPSGPADKPAEPFEVFKRKVDAFLPSEKAHEQWAEGAVRMGDLAASSEKSQESRDAGIGEGGVKLGSTANEQRASGKAPSKPHKPQYVCTNWWVYGYCPGQCGRPHVWSDGLLGSHEFRHARREGKLPSHTKRALDDALFKKKLEEDRKAAFDGTRPLTLRKRGDGQDTEMSSS